MKWSISMPFCGRSSTVGAACAPTGFVAAPITAKAVASLVCVTAVASMVASTVTAVATTCVSVLASDGSPSGGFATPTATVLAWRRRRGESKNNERGVDGDRDGTNADAGTTDKAQAKTQDRLLGRIEESRTPRLPAGDYMVVIRPGGGLWVAQLDPTEMNRCIYEAAGIPFEDAEST
ncbi:hypothetical protein MTO96_038639 [Rhipicephalus appendiculatus]